MTVKFPKLILIAGDALALFTSLVLALFIRSHLFRGEFFVANIKAFIPVFILFLIAYYIGDLYNLRNVKDTVRATRRLTILLGVGSVIATLYFYLTPETGISPKTILALFLALFAFIDYGWRRFFAGTVSINLPQARIVLFGRSIATEELIVLLRENPGLGYVLTEHIADFETVQDSKGLIESMREKKIRIIVVAQSLKQNPKTAALLYEAFLQGFAVMDVADLYADLFNKIPLGEVDEVWLLRNIRRRHALYDAVKRPVELLLAFALMIATAPIVFLIALGIALSSPGTIFYSQTRAGEMGRMFRLVKFRTMRSDAEKNGPQWAAQKDNRVTAFGAFLRATHLDELPQLWNIVKGNLSFVGPRPERPEFAAPLMKQIPFFGTRLAVKPGITGWAQINFRYGATIEDAREKLEYDLYYLMHRSLALDILTVIKTVRFFFSNHA